MCMMNPVFCLLFLSSVEGVKWSINVCGAGNGSYQSFYVFHIFSQEKLDLYCEGIACAERYLL